MVTKVAKSSRIIGSICGSPLRGLPGGSAWQLAHVRQVEAVLAVAGSFFGPGGYTVAFPYARLSRVIGSMVWSGGSCGPSGCVGVQRSTYRGGPCTGASRRRNEPGPLFVSLWARCIRYRCEDLKAWILRTGSTGLPPTLSARGESLEPWCGFIGTKRPARVARRLLGLRPRDGARDVVPDLLFAARTGSSAR